MHTRNLLAGSVLVLMGALACNKPSPKLQARIDSLQAASDERDRLVQEMAQNARMVSDISAQLAKVQIRSKLTVSSESPSQAARDSLVQEVQYIATHLNQARSQLRRSERRIRSLTSISDSLRTSLAATIANYDSVVSMQRDQLTIFSAQVDSLRTENATLTTTNVALKDTVNDLSLRENTVYYVIGSKDDLKQRGIVAETGGSRFLFVFWKSGKSLQPARSLDPAAFTAIDKRQVTSIPFPDSSKTYRIASRQDLSALATPPDQDGRLQGAGLEIAEPTKFWAASKYLIIVES